ncbi:hypothetical protein ABW21_db0208109 [Orbilia brochopaga]|nr:hypothetical protein ABW21_db0208109 [Drechslerella brochopaga]
MAGRGHGAQQQQPVERDSRLGSMVHAIAISIPVSCIWIDTRIYWWTGCEMIANLRIGFNRGPLLSALLLSLLLSITAAREQATNVFSGVFAIIWIGEALVTLQIRLLGGSISFFQSVCVIGYTLFPIVVAALLSAVKLHAIIRVPLYAFFFLWSLAAGVSILGGSGVVRNRVALAVFPLGLFYFLLTCLCLIS